MHRPQQARSVAAAMSPTAGAQSSFGSIDRHALAADCAQERSVERLAAYLTRPAANEEEAARAIFRWIAANIAYDTGRPGSPPRALVNGGAAAVLVRRSALCGGIAELFGQLGRAAGLETTTVSGFSKGQGYRVGGRLRGEPDHAWNAVRIRGQWRLLDATWGGGAYMGRKYVRQFDGHYFLPPPAQFIYDHLPEDPAWQLLEQPLCKAEFEALPHLKPGFFRHGLELGSHLQGTITTGAKLDTVLGVPPAVWLHAELRTEGRRLGKSLVFCQREEERYKLRVAFPRSGVYTLRIFANASGPPEPFEWVMDYRVRAVRGAGGQAGYPIPYAAFSERGATLRKPFQRLLRAGQTHRFGIRVPGVMEVALLAGGQWIPLEERDGEFSGKVAVPKGRIMLAAKQPQGKKFDVLLEYRGY
ncbi:MAG: hypothetical protein O7C61_13940 [SAR324 cluster bacterium]|nr:hypothetical protein [SAR324 cluster bacterium]